MSRAWNTLHDELLQVRVECEVLGCGAPAAHGHHSLIGRSSKHAKIIDKEINWQAACVDCNVTHRVADTYEALVHAVRLQVGLHGARKVRAYLEEVKKIKPFSVKTPMRILEGIENEKSN